MGSVPTRERLLIKALELFALKGFEAVSVREITRSLNLNEATLYIHFKNKSDLLDKIIERFEQKLISPGFARPEPPDIDQQDSRPLSEILVAGAQIFFTRADKEILLTWRMLMVSQYRHEAAKKSLISLVLDPPIMYFTAMLDALQKKGKLRPDVDCHSAGRIIASIFFQFSFRSNLLGAWNEPFDVLTDELNTDLRLFAKTLS